MSSTTIKQMKSCLKKAATTSPEEPGAPPPKKKSVQFSTTSWLYTIPQAGLGRRLTKHPRLLPPTEWPANGAAQVQLARERTKKARAAHELYRQWMKTQGWISIAYGASKKQLTREWRQYAECRGLQREIPRTLAATSTVEYASMEDLSLAEEAEIMRLDEDHHESVHDPLCCSPDDAKAFQVSSTNEASHKDSAAKIQHSQRGKIWTMKRHSDIQQHPEDKVKVKSQDEKQESDFNDIESIGDDLGRIAEELESIADDLERVADELILSLKQLLAISLVTLVVSLGMFR